MGVWKPTAIFRNELFFIVEVGARVSGKAYCWLRLLYPPSSPTAVRCHLTPRFLLIYV